MSTRKIVPRANGEGSIGDDTIGVEKYWGGVFTNILNGTDAIELASFNQTLQIKRSTNYGVGEIGFSSKLQAGMYLSCIVDGITDSVDITIPQTVTPNITTIVDGSVTWIVRKLANTNDLLQKLREPSTEYSSGDIRYLKTLPTGWFLEVKTAGFTSNDELIINNPDVGDDVADGTVTWTIRKTGSGDGGDSAGIPLGAIIPFAGTTPPSGFLLCNGAAVSRTMYPDLFTLIGTSYGPGDGETTFNLPDYRFIADNEIPVFGNGKTLAFSDGTILFGERTSSTSAMSYTTSAYGQEIGTALTSGTGLTSGRVAGIATKSLLGNTPENSGLVAELTDSDNTKYVIKAFDGQTPDSALIDVTQYAQALANINLNKANVDLDNLSAAGLAKIQQQGGDIIVGNLAKNGYVKFKNGLIIQWGYHSTSMSNNAKVTITYPVPYTEFVIPSAIVVRNKDTSYGIMVLNGLPTLTTAQFMQDGDYGELGFYWMTIGK